MEVRYEKIPLTVDAQFSETGDVTPLRILYRERCFEINYVLRVRRHSPFGVCCLAPLEYTVVVEGRPCCIFFEPETELWYSVKKISF